MLKDPGPINTTGWGARGTFYTGTDACMGLKLGTINASHWDVSAITGLKWHEVAPYRLLGGQNDVVPGHNSDKYGCLELSAG